MTLITFFKKLIGGHSVITPKLEEEIILFDNINTWIVNKKKKIDDEEKGVLKLISERISLCMVELEEKIILLEEFDLESKNVEERIKLIVKHNMINYLHSLNHFIKGLKNLNGEKLENVIVNINELLFDFHKQTHVTYQKVTILIGKEIADIKKTINNLSKDLAKIVKEKENVINSSTIIFSVQEKLLCIAETNKQINEINKEIKLCDKKIKQNKEMNRNISRKIRTIEKTKKHIENLKKQEELFLLEKELKKNLLELRTKIDFKSLGNIFHVSEKKMREVSFHKEHFAEAFLKDSGRSLEQLLNEAKLNNMEISELIIKTNTKENNLNKNKTIIKKDETESLSSKLKDLLLLLENLNDEKNNEVKKLKKIENNKKNVLHKIKQELAKISVVLKLTK